jgi:hypothetical protein
MNDKNSEKVNLQTVTMPRVLVQSMINNYRKNQLVAIGNDSENGVKDDAHSTWFDLADLKTFIETIEKNAPEENKGLGIRFYYAAYPDSNLFGKEEYESLESFNKDEMQKQYGKRHTLILVPTINENGVNKDFNPESIAISEAVIAKNHGNLIPPNKPFEETY